MRARARRSGAEGMLWDARLEPLVSVERGESVESVHRGVMVLVDAHGRVLGGAGDPRLPMLLRSAAKPFQALPLVATGVADRLGVTAEELAVACSSHHAQPEHLREVHSLLARAGVDESALTCGPQAPLDEAERRELDRRGEPARPLHNTCSGKHAGMLALARGLGADSSGYVDRGHPVQESILRSLAELLQAGPDGAGCAPRDGPGPAPLWGRRRRVRGAGVPGHGPAGGLPLRPSGPGSGPGLAHVRDAMLAHPVLVSGTGGLDSAVMRAWPGGVVAKGGAEGVQALGFPATEHRGPVGCLIKVGDGAGRPYGRWWLWRCGPWEKTGRRGYWKVSRESFSATLPARPSASCGRW